MAQQIEEKGKLEMARNLLQKEIDIDIIAESSKLPLSTLEKLKIELEQEDDDE